MSTATTSNDLIDQLVQKFFRVEPNVMASLAHGDAHVRLRRLPMTEPTTDPLDGLEVFVRRTLAACLKMRKQQRAVSLVTERQARDAGWPSAHSANLAIVLAWALGISEPDIAMPLLLEAEETAKRPNRLIRVDDARLPTYDSLIASLRRSRRFDARARARSERGLQGAPAVPGRRLVSLDALLRDWLGVDVDTVELRGDTDPWAPRLTSSNARAVGCLAWIANEVIDLVDVMQDEDVSAVREKTDLDARLAGQPGADAANLALLLAAATNHGSGYTVHFLPPQVAAADALVAAGRRAAARRGEAGDYQAQTTELLELEDVAARGYIHVGRSAVGRVALRLFDGATGAR